ncbi:MAG: 2-oxoglutarate dehydrogenase E1 component [Alphaproteobacteria bacterium]|nr:2-oxoglutarate dehydrogenase E1 component [Alphaproteobacteria bacterium]MCB9793889.1 2-oxoglutarate dehydrogenase E1 component [Alphaproteobacteria bacterium]
MDINSLLNGENAAFLDDSYSAWLHDPSSVDPWLQELFEGLGERPAVNGGLAPGQTPCFPRRSIFNPLGGAAPVRQVDVKLASKVPQIINAYRVRGHMLAQVDPLNRREQVEHPEMSLGYYGLSERDLDKPVSSSPVFGEPPTSTLRKILDRVHKAYCGSLGSEFMNIQDLEQKLWLQERLETIWDQPLLTKEEELRVLSKLSLAEGFERMLHTRFPGTKRFSLEGAEPLIPLLGLLIEYAGQKGVTEIIFGMAHRGRLNVLTNILDKPAQMIVAEFEDELPTSFQGSGDVKYHLGYSSDQVTLHGDVVHLSMAFNPSHLEAVNPVVEGRVRAKQDRYLFDHPEEGRAHIKKGMAMLLHGDAAFAGQGLVAETLNLSDLAGYRTGGTVHVIVNNQIGFTTPPHEARSTPYATDVARMLGVPIFHVNGEDPKAVAAAVRLAVEWRQTFHRDVVIDMYCYRKHGHNEGDEPSFTQPLLYDDIRSRPSPREVYARALVESGDLSQDEIDRVFGVARERLEGHTGTDKTQDSYTGNVKSEMGQLWSNYLHGSLQDAVNTGYPLESLRRLLLKANTLPTDFNAHRKIRRLLKQRREVAEGERPVSWAEAEQAAYASLVVDGVRVRLSGQDSGRGTFSHRHAVLADVSTGKEIFPLDMLEEGQARFQVMDSLLSEAAVLGFEYGYSLDYPDALVMWEAQFGDFANGAQVIIDQFIVSGEQKWNRASGLVMLLPHGYEGQGPEHSSARIERYLMLCAEDNIQLANVTTPANLFHLMRRQALRKVRKPLIVFTPKSLLRHPRCISTMEDLAEGSFQRLIPETEALEPAEVKRLVFCSGKVYYDLLAEREERGERRVALARVEELYPYPQELIAAEVERFPNAEVVWVQEEPRNMGAWPVYCDWLREQLPRDRQPRYIGRKPAASPATGSHGTHARESRCILDNTFAF